ATSAATTVMPATTAGDAATVAMPQTSQLPGTAQLPAADADGDDQDPADGSKKKRSAWTWPLITLIALVVLVGIGTAIALMNQGGGTPEQTTPSTSDTPKTSETPEPTAGPVSLDDVVGMQWEDAVRALNTQGFPDVVAEEGEPADGDQVGTVYAVDPTGDKVPFTSRITLTYYAAYGEVDRPARASASPSPVASGQLTNVSWPTATCPVPLQLQSYDVTVEGDGAKAGNVSGNGIQVQANTLEAGAPNGEIIVRYTVTCGDGGSITRTSQASPGLRIAVTAPAAPDPGDEEE
ncbi:PASTA domain-containing protein, partial [Leucobacter soli]